MSTVNPAPAPAPGPSGLAAIFNTLFSTYLGSISGAKTYLAATLAFVGALLKVLAIVNDVANGNPASLADITTAWTALTAALGLAGLRHAVAKGS